jgi:hypothetical protein
LGIAIVRLGALGLVIAAAFGYVIAHPHSGANACGVAGPFDFDTLEAESYTVDYGKAIDLAVEGKAISFNYSVAGDPVDLRYQGLVSGPRNARLPVSTQLRVPPSVYKSTVWIEANWNHAAAKVPFGGVGPILTSFDCGYGLGQITTGMSNNTNTASARQGIIGTHYLFNLAEGVRIMADKWNSAPRFRPVAGKGDPTAIEDWYFAIWSYNGFAFSNHPLNPGLDPLRGGKASSPIFHCYDLDAESIVLVDGKIAFGRGSFTYPENVYGCMRNPPKMEIPPAKDKVRMWPAQEFFMPDFSRKEVAAAFDPQNFLDCQEAGFAGGCPLMDFPTSWPDDPETKDVNEERKTHRDGSPPADAALVSKFLGSPQFQYTGATEFTLTAYSDGTATEGIVVVRNVGTWIAPFRIRSTVPWIVVRHPGDPATRTLDGGVAIGKETQVVTQNANTTRPRIATPGYESRLSITLDPSKMPPGTVEGKVFIEPLLGSGGAFEVKIRATGGATTNRYRVVAPGLSAGQ